MSGAQALRLELSVHFPLFLIDTMTMENKEVFDASGATVSPEELRELTKRWGPTFRLAALTAQETNTLFTSLRRGVQHIAAILPQYLEWIPVIEQVARLDETAWTTEGMGAPQAPAARLAQLLIKQPSNSLRELEQKQCLALASIAFLAVAAGQPLQNTFVHGLDQQFKSQHPGWVTLRALDCLDPKLLLHLDNTDFIPVVRTHAKQLGQLLARGIQSPAVYLGRAGQQSVRDLLTPAEDDTAQPCKSLHAKQVIAPDDTSVDFDLFTSKMVNDCQVEYTKGYRLPDQWDALSPGELKRVLNKLVPQLKQKKQDPESVQLRVHAAGRVVSLVVGMSLKQCLRLPIGRKGSVHLNLREGVIRRDSRKVAPRKNHQKEKKSVAGGARFFQLKW